MKNRISGIKDSETVNVKVKSRLSGEEYEGMFHWRRRQLDDIGRISMAMSGMTGGQIVVDQGLGVLLRTIAELDVVIVEAPDWWEEVKDIPDQGLIMAVNTQYLEWLNAPFRKHREALEAREAGTKEG